MDDKHGELESRTIEWLEKVIDSCNNTIHFKYTQGLLDRFIEQNENEEENVSLQDYFNQAYNDKHFIIVPPIS